MNPPERTPSKDADNETQNREWAINMLWVVSYFLAFVVGSIVVSLWLSP